MLLNDFGSGLCTQNIIGSGSVQIHRFEILKVRVRFSDLKFKRFRFGSGSPKKSGFYQFAVRFDSLIKTFIGINRRVLQLPAKKNLGDYTAVQNFGAAYSPNYYFCEVSANLAEL